MPQARDLMMKSSGESPSTSAAFSTSPWWEDRDFMRQSLSASASRESEGTSWVRKTSGASLRWTGSRSMTMCPLREKLARMAISERSSERFPGQG